MSEAPLNRTSVPSPPPPNNNNTYPKIVLMHSTEDEMKIKTKEIYIHLYAKLHELYSTSQIFAMAYQASVDFESYWIELKTRVNINFESDIRKYAGEDAVKALKKMTKEKENLKRKTR
jgi:hypothetical protein